MTKRQPLGLRHTLWLALGLTGVSIVLGATALYRYELYRSARQSRRACVQVVAETYAAQFAPLLSQGRQGQARALIEGFAWHPDSLLLAVLDAHGEVVGFAGDRLLLDRFLQRAGLDQGDPLGPWDIPVDPGRNRPAMTLAATVIQVANGNGPLGTLVYAARDTMATAVAPGEVWRFFTGLLLIAATGLLLGLLWLQQKVVAPLTSLTRQSRAGLGDKPAAADLVGRHDEIGELARALAEMHRNLHESQQRAARLERSVDDRVAAETQRITRELRQVEKKIWTDPLTHLGNRRLFDEKFAEIFNAQRDARQDLSIVMIDVDHFKNLNDTLGHQAGDEVLAFIGELLKQGLREQDLAIRYGGDEFVLILPSVSSEQAHNIAERTIRMFAQQAKLLRVQPSPSMSAGIASLRTHQATTPQGLLETADRALYEAKHRGRGQVAVASAHGRKPVQT